MRSRANFTGMKFGNYTAMNYAGDGKWLCRCDCGNDRYVFTGNLTKRQSNSCGCQKASVTREKITRHGRSDTPVHRSWMSMRQRCKNENDHAFKNYGGRGIKICSRWDTFENFLADMGEMPKGYEIDRLDVNGDYEPSNCRWATVQEQNRNKRNSRWITFNGETRCMAEWCQVTGVTPSALQKRLSLGWDVEKALTTPMRKHKCQATAGATIKSV